MHECKKCRMQTCVCALVHSCIRVLWCIIAFWHSVKRSTSRQTPLVARYRSIARGEATDLMLLDGPHLVADALASGILLRQVALTAEALGRPEVRAIVARLVQDRIEMVTAAQPVMAA